MACRNCHINCLASVMGKCGDLFTLNLEASGNMIEGEGVPNDVGIGGGDYIRFTYCLNCGQIQGNFPVETPTSNPE